MTDSIHDQNLNVDVIVENFNQVEEIQNDFYFYYDDNFKKFCLIANGSVEYNCNEGHIIQKLKVFEPKQNY